MSISKEDVLNLHDLVLENSGVPGTPGVLNPGMLDSCLDNYTSGVPWLPPSEDRFERIAALLRCLILFHPFVDGNKRTAIVTASTLLRKVGYIFECEIEEVITVLIQVALDTVEVQEITEWLRSHSNPIVL